MFLFGISEIVFMLTVYAMNRCAVLRSVRMEEALSSLAGAVTHFRLRCALVVVRMRRLVVGVAVGSDPDAAVLVPDHDRQ